MEYIGLNTYWMPLVMVGWMQLCFQYINACYYKRTLKINYDDSSLCFDAARLDSYYYEDFTLKLADRIY